MMKKTDVPNFYYQRKGVIEQKNDDELARYFKLRTEIEEKANMQTRLNILTEEVAELKNMITKLCIKLNKE